MEDGAGTRSGMGSQVGLVCGARLDKHHGLPEMVLERRRPMVLPAVLPLTRLTADWNSGRRPALNSCHPGRPTNPLRSNTMVASCSWARHPRGWVERSSTTRSVNSGNRAESIGRASAHDPRKLPVPFWTPTSIQPTESHGQCGQLVCPPSLLNCAWDAAQHGFHCSAHSHVVPADWLGGTVRRK